MSCSTVIVKYVFRINGQFCSQSKDRPVMIMTDTKSVMIDLSKCDNK